MTLSESRAPELIHNLQFINGIHLCPKWTQVQDVLVWENPSPSFPLSPREIQLISLWVCFQSYWLKVPPPRWIPGDGCNEWELCGTTLIHVFIHSILIECLLWASHGTKCWGYSEQNRKTPAFQSSRAQILNDMCTKLIYNYKLLRL